MSYTEALAREGYRWLLVYAVHALDGPPRSAIRKQAEVATPAGR